jgi:hypothetical protein
MARLSPNSSRCSAARAALLCLLAGSVVTASLPESALLRVACSDTARVPSECQDPLPDDTELPEGETSTGDFELLVPAQRRLSLLPARDGSCTPKLLWPWTVLSASRPRPWWLIRFDTGVDRVGHFLAEGRALRLWFQSQVC